MNKLIFTWDHFPTDYMTNGRCDEVEFGPVIGEEKDESITIASCLDYSAYAEIIYVQLGENDEKPWIYLVKHKDGYYVLFDAWCDYTGFDCRGSLSLNYSKDRERMFQFGLGERIRKDIESNTLTFHVKPENENFIYVNSHGEIQAFERSDTTGWEPVCSPGYNNKANPGQIPGYAGEASPGQIPGYAGEASPGQIPGYTHLQKFYHTYFFKEKIMGFSWSDRTGWSLDYRGC